MTYPFVSLARIDHFRNSSRAEETIRSYCNHSTTERNARLALLYFYSVEVFEGRKSPNVLLKALTDHFRDFSKKVVCFLDCKPWLSNLDIVGQDQLLLEAAQCAQDSKPQKGNLEVSNPRPINLLCVLLPDCYIVQYNLLDHP